MATRAWESAEIHVVNVPPVVLSGQAIRHSFQKRYLIIRGYIRGLDRYMLEILLAQHGTFIVLFILSEHANSPKIDDSAYDLLGNMVQLGV